MPAMQDPDDLTSGIANGYIVAQVFYDIFMVRFHLFPHQSQMTSP